MTRFTAEAELEEGGLGKDTMGTRHRVVGCRSLAGALALCLVVSGGCSPDAQNGTLWPESYRDSDYALDFFAFQYLPKESRAREAAKIYWCGTPILQFLESHDPQIEEHVLFERAKRLQRWYAPEELTSGPFMTSDVCETEGCRGTVPLSLQITPL